MNAVNRIVNELRDNGVLVSPEDVMGKMHSLRVYYGSTRSKAEASKKKSGSGRDDVIKVKWHFYDKLFFLNDNLTPRTTVSNLQTEVNDFDEDSCGSPSSCYSTENLPISKKSKRKRSNAYIESSGDNNLIETATDVLRDIRDKNREKVSLAVSSEKTADDLFCEMLAKQFKELTNVQTKEVLKYEIQGMLLRSKFEPGFNQNTQGFSQRIPNFSSLSYGRAASTLISPSMTSSMTEQPLITNRIRSPNFSSPPMTPTQESPEYYAQH